MATCPQCGATVTKSAVTCGNCEAAINTTSKSINIYQSKVTEQDSTPFPNASEKDLAARLEKAMRRAELLSYAAAILGLALLGVIIIISLL